MDVVGVMVAYCNSMCLCVCVVHCLESHKLDNKIFIVEFVSERMSYIELRGRWCNIIVLNAHTPSEEKSVDSNDSFYEVGKHLSSMFFIRNGL